MWHPRLTTEFPTLSGIPGIWEMSVWKRMTMKGKPYLLFMGLIVQMSSKARITGPRKRQRWNKGIYQKSANFKFNELKVEWELECRVSQLAAVLMDVNNHTQWVYKTVKSQLLKTTGVAELYFYTEIECPWPFENRDLVVHVKVLQNVENKIMTVTAQNMDDYLPVKANIVRMKYSKVIWKATPINSKILKIDYQIQIDPGGSVPALLLNSFAAKGPFESFMKLKKEVKLAICKKTSLC